MCASFLWMAATSTVRRYVLAEEASRAFDHYISSVGARIGTTVRVILTDGGDCICFEWQFGKGITFPAKQG